MFGCGIPGVGVWLWLEDHFFWMAFLEAASTHCPSQTRLQAPLLATHFGLVPMGASRPSSGTGMVFAVLAATNGASSFVLGSRTVTGVHSVCKQVRRVLSRVPLLPA